MERERERELGDFKRDFMEDYVTSEVSYMSYHAYSCFCLVDSHDSLLFGI